MSMNDGQAPWQPQRGDRVLAVLPDDHEIEGTYVCGALTQVRHHVEPQMLHTIEFDDGSHAYVLTVKRAPTQEPEEFGACVTDANGIEWINGGRYLWISKQFSSEVSCSWPYLRQPVTVNTLNPWAASRGQ